MAQTPTLTRDIGQLERTLRALLDPLLEEAGLTFPEWALLVFLETAGPLTRRELVARELAGRIASRAKAEAAIDELVEAGLIGPHAHAGDPALSQTSAGRTVFRPISREVARITERLYGDLDPADVERVRDVLGEVTRRAERLVEERAAAG